MEEDSEFPMVSLDVDWLFSKIPLGETIDICANTIFKNIERVGLSKIEFKELLSLAAKESNFILMESSTSKLMESLWGRL